MTRRTTWTVIVVVLALVVAGALAWRAKGGAGPKAGPSAAAPAASAPVALDLAPADVLAVRRVDLVRTLAVSGGLKAVDSAMVKAKVAASC